MKCNKKEGNKKSWKEKERNEDVKEIKGGTKIRKKQKKGTEKGKRSVMKGSSAIETATVTALDSGEVPASTYRAMSGEKRANTCYCWRTFSDAMLNPVPYDFRL
jgi:hypothetical protein